MNIRRSLSNLFRSRQDAELARRAIAEREEELEERRQSQERMRELPDLDNESVDSKNKMRKIFGSKDV